MDPGFVLEKCHREPQMLPGDKIDNRHQQVGESHTPYVLTNIGQMLGS